MIPPFIEPLYTLITLDEPEYNPPATFTHGEWMLVAAFPKRHEDGQPAEVYEVRCPTSFWRIMAYESPNSVGEIKPGFCLNTGSGKAMGHLAFGIARAIAGGMLGLGETEISQNKEEEEDE